MKFFAAFFVFVLWNSPAFAQSHSFGLGLILGSPTGISGKYYVQRDRAIDGALAWSLGDESNWHLHGDYLWQTNNVFKDNEGRIDLFYGVGARLVLRDPPPNTRDAGSKFGPRFPIGLRHMFRDPRIEAFLEFALILNLVPKTNVDADLGVGGRYYF